MTSWCFACNFCRFCSSVLRDFTRQLRANCAIRKVRIRCTASPSLMDRTRSFYRQHQRAGVAFCFDLLAERGVVHATKGFGRYRQLPANFVTDRFSCSTRFMLYPVVRKRERAETELKVYPSPSAVRHGETGCWQARSSFSPDRSPALAANGVTQTVAQCCLHQK